MEQPVSGLMTELTRNYPVSNLVSWIYISAVRMRAAARAAAAELAKADYL